uniref:Large ribosomal subunit protein eL34 n=1 Tax=Timema californicum TaxID=61474 RepID=A0A7R9J5S6_TIMCA|nr:unnamed protein product [Timema californicum]
MGRLSLKMEGFGALMDDCRISVRTPGGKLVYQYLKKPKKIPRCGQCKDKLRGIQPARPMERSRMCKRKKTVKRVYGGVLCHKCVKESSNGTHSAHRRKVPVERLLYSLVLALLLVLPHLLLYLQAFRCLLRFVAP